jgi:hypothetical protein
MPRLKLRYLTMITTFIFLIFISLILINRKHKNIFYDPISAIGNLSKNYPIFVIGSIITFLLFTYIILNIYQKEKIKVGWEVFSVPILGISSILVPYRDHLPILKNVHNFLAVLSAILILRLIYIYNNETQSKKIKTKFHKHIPEIAFFGTLILYLATGMNTLIELFYIVIVFYWINQVSYDD